jgi:hypothetical protein
MTVSAPTDVRLEEILVSSEPLKTATIVVGEKSFEITYKSLSWLDKTSCVALATEYMPVSDESGQVRDVKTVFHIDIYFEEALRRMIVKAPWPMSKQVLRNLTPEVGQQLEALIPSPLGDTGGPLARSEPSETRSKAARKTH